MNAPGPLYHAPVSFFTVTMGIFGLALTLKAGGFGALGMGVGSLGALVLAALFGLLLAKIIYHPAAVKAEWDHPVKMTFFPAASISVLLLATFLIDVLPGVARVLWLIGAASHGVLTLMIISAWIGHRAFGPGQLSPAWFIPPVGSLMAPIGGVALGYVEVSWYFFALGILFWLMLLTLVFNRLIFHDPLPQKLQPTIAILIAPPALGFVAWVQLHGAGVDALAHMLINLGYFFTALVALQLPALLRLPFALSFWALSFPLAGIALASFRFAELTGSAAHSGLGYGLLAALCVVLTVLVLRTIQGIMSGALFQPD